MVFRKHVSVMMLAVLLLSLFAMIFSPISQAANITVLSEDFESTPAGQVPTGWTASSDNQVSVTETTYGRRLSLKESANGTTSSTSVNFTPIIGSATVEMRVMAEQTGYNVNFLTLKSSNGDKVLELLFDRNEAHTSKNISSRILQNNGWTNLQQYNPNQWYDIRVDIHTQTQKFDIIIDGTKVASNVAFINEAIDIAQYSLSSFRYDKGNYHVDNIRISVLNNAPVAGDVTIAGSAVAGQTLTGSYTYSDTEEDAEGSTAFQWYRGALADGSDKAPISGATSLTYKTGTEDADQYVFFEVTPAASAGTVQGSPAVSAPVQVQAPLPKIYSEDFQSYDAGLMPSEWITGTLDPDDLVAVSEDTNGNKYLTLVETANSKTTKASVNFGPIEGSATIDMRVMAEQTGYNGSFLNLYSGSGTKILELMFDRNESHTSKNISRRIVTNNGWVNMQQYSANQWYNIHVDVNMEAQTYGVKIDGVVTASNVPFLNQASDIGQYAISSYRFDAGTYHVDDILISKPDNQGPVAKNVGINGTPAVGQTLTGVYTYSDTEGDAEAGTTFQWYSSANSDGTGKSAIAGATGQLYTLAEADEGKYIYFGVTPAAETGGSPGSVTFSLPVQAGPPLEPDAETYLSFDQLPVEASKGEYLPVLRTDGIALDGNFDKYRSLTGIKLENPDPVIYKSWTGPDDLSVESYFAYDAQNFYFAVKATDEAHNAIPGSSNWQGDGIQYAFGEPAFASFNTEFGVALDGASGNITRFNEGMAMLDPSAVQMNFTQSGNDTIYEMAIPWETVISTAPIPGQIIPFTFLVNDNEGNGRQGYIEWTGGIGASKDVGLYGRIELIDQDDAWSSWIIGSDQVLSGETPQYTLYIPNFSDNDLSLTLDIPPYGVSGESVTVPAHQIFKKTFSVTINNPQNIAVTITEPSTGKSRRESVQVLVTKSAAEIAAMLTALETIEIPRLQGKLDQAAQLGIPTDYETVNVRTIKEFIKYGRDDLANARQSRAQYMAETMYALGMEAELKLDAYLAGEDTPFTIPRYVTGKTTIQNYSMIGDTTTEADRPIFFTGYGMFGQVKKDVPIFSELGTNLVDYNFYPLSTIVQDSGPDGFRGDTSKVISDLGKLLSDAEAHNIAVNIDLAPHSFPTWVYDANHWPDVRNSVSLYSQKWDFENPKFVDLVKAHINAVIPLIKDSPALQAVTLTTEPNYYKNGGVYHLNNWHAYLAEQYATVADMNTMYGTAYAIFSDVPVPNVDAFTGSPLYYDYLTFKTQKFNEFHKMMADEVHKLAPDLPVHIKIMGYGAIRRDPIIKWGLDPEYYAEISEINGNDNGNQEEGGSKGYLDALGLYDLQASYQKKPIFNSEDHIITDGDERYIPEIAKSSANSLWTGALHGRTLSAVWTWERSYDTVGKAYLQGSILNRPDAVTAVGHVNLDLNRLAREVTAFQDAPAEVAILNSFTANLYSQAHFSLMKRSYGAMSYTGQKVGFITENQINDTVNNPIHQYKLLVLPEASRISADTLINIRHWVENGGRVVTIGDPANLLQRNEHNLPLSAADRDAVLNSPNTTQVAPNPTQDELRVIFFSELERLGMNKVIVYDAATNQPVSEAEWRIAEYEGQQLLSLINFSQTDKSVYVKVNGVQVTPVRELLSAKNNTFSALPLGGLEHYLYVLPKPADHLAPATVASASSAPNEAGWYNKDVIVTMQAMDNPDGSGVAELYYSTAGAQAIGETMVTGALASVVIGSEGVTVLSFYAKDAAGNIEEVRQLEIKLDKTAPVLSITGGGTYTVDQTVNIACSAADTVSGITTDPCGALLADAPAYSLELGNHTLTVQVTDRAGNSVETVISYTISVTKEAIKQLTGQYVTGPGTHGIINSLVKKLEHNNFESFIHEVSAQAGKKINVEHAEILIRLVNELK